MPRLAPVTRRTSSTRLLRTPRLAAQPALLTPRRRMRDARSFVQYTSRRDFMGQFIDLKPADGAQIPAYVAQPAGQPKGGIVVIQEIFGVNSHIRSVADGYAAEGYLAVAPAIFQRVKPGVELGYEQ